MTMLLDLPGRFLYRHRFDTYAVMRVFCTRYRCIACVAVLLVVIALIAWLERPEVLAALGIAVRAD
jgi:hypothetical protein